MIVLRPIAGKTNKGFKPIPLDALTYDLIAIDQMSHKIHDGDEYIILDTQNVSTTILKWMVITPDIDVQIHAVFDIVSTGEVDIIITEGADRVAGTSIPIVNRNRWGTPNVSEVTASRTPTGGTTDGSVVIFRERTGSTGVGGKTLIGGGNKPESKYVLKRNTKYIISVETFADAYVSLGVDYYEHTPKE